MFRADRKGRMMKRLDHKETMTFFTIFLSFNLFTICSKNEPSCEIVPVNFVKSTQVFDSLSTFQTVLGDLDRDGDLDLVFSINGPDGCRVLFNDGKGYFTESDQRLTDQGHGVGIGDLDRDGDLDMLMTCAGYDHLSKIYFNEGQGKFTDSQQDLGDFQLSGNAVFLHDMDGDGDLDGLIDYYQKDNIIYLNDGKGRFSDSGKRYPDNSSSMDLDSDGDVDIFTCDMGKGYRTLLNDGRGNFLDHWSYPDTSLVRCFRGFGDIDHDGDIDVIVTNGNRRQSHPTKILFNDGTGTFVEGEQTLSPVFAGRVGVGDVNQDGHQDIVLTSYRRPNEIWLNNGNGEFLKTLELENNGAFHTALLEDIDSDGDLDLIIANYSGGSNEIWFNRKK